MFSHFNLHANSCIYNICLKNIKRLDLNLLVFNIILWAGYSSDKEPTFDAGLGWNASKTNWTPFMVSRPNITYSLTHSLLTSLSLLFSKTGWYHVWVYDFTSAWTVKLHCKIARLEIIRECYALAQPLKHVAVHFPPWPNSNWSRPSLRDCELSKFPL